MFIMITCVSWLVTIRHLNFAIPVGICVIKSMVMYSCKQPPFMVLLPISDCQLRHLQQSRANRLKQAFRPGTQMNHQVQVKRYYIFCMKFHLQDLHPPPSNLTLYLEYLSEHLKSVQSVKNYLSAIGFIHRQLGLECKSLQSHEVSTMLRAIDHTLR